MSVKIFEIGQQDKSLLYCNGICSNHADESQRANFDQQTELLTSVFPNRKVVVYNNPTGLGEFFTNDAAQNEQIEAIATQFSKLIREKIKDAKQERVPIVAHSHGALITKLALERLQAEERAMVDVYAFGGVVMLPKALACSVKNYVFKGDMIAQSANDKFDPKGVLQRVIQAAERSQLDQVSLEDALFNQFKKDWFREYQWGTDKIPEFVSNFWLGDPDKVKGADEKYHEYASCLRDYDITLLPSPPKPLKDRSITAVTPEMKQSIASFGSTVDQAWHKLFNFRPTLEEIAKIL